jgi:PPOX class probable F420-dependent enzyme
MTRLDPSPIPLDQRPFRPLGGQPAFDADDIVGFVEQRRIGVLAYVRADGRPNQAPIWYVHRDGAFHMSTTTTGPKRRAIERNPRISLTIQDERPPYRAVIVDGTASLRPLDDGTDDPTDAIATRYLGRLGAAAYDRMTRELYDASGLTLITLVPDEIKGFDNVHTLSRAELAFTRLREHLPIPRRLL